MNKLIVFSKSKSKIKQFIFDSSIAKLKIQYLNKKYLESYKFEVKSYKLKLFGR